MKTGIFTENEVIALACLSFGYIDGDHGISKEFIDTLERLVMMGFVKKSGDRYLLVEVPPMAKAAVEEKKKVLRIRQAPPSMPVSEAHSEHPSQT